MIIVKLWEYDAVVNAELIESVYSQDGVTTIEMINGHKHESSLSFTEVTKRIKEAVNETCKR